MSLEEIEAVYHGETFRWGETIVGQVELCNGSRLPNLDPWISIKGEADDDELEPRRRYRFYGRFSNYTNRRTGITEKQFHFQTFVVAQSHDERGVVEYLVSAGQGLGIGRATAKRAFERFGPDAIRLIRDDPSILHKISNRITSHDAEILSARLQACKATEDATIELTGLLAGRGLPKTTARNAIKLWGNLAAQVIRRDPYKLMRLRGVGFKRADSLWLEFGLPPHRIKRQVMAAWHELASNSDGHTWFPAEVAVQAIKQNIGSARAMPARAIKCGIRLGQVSPHHYGAMAKMRTDGDHGPIIESGGKLWLAEASDAWAESSLAEMLTDAIQEGRPNELTQYADETIIEHEKITYTQCHRCGRELTAPEVHVVGGIPYGPTCVKKLGQVDDVEIVPLADWIAGATREIRHVVSVPVGTVEMPNQSLWPDADSIQGITDHQREQIRASLTSRVAILSGSPGVGKTFATAQVIRSILASGKVSPQDIAIGCPTGKAAVRLTETMHAAGLTIRARTWHSLLGYSEMGFQHGEDDPWPFRVLIGDESSMIDTSLMRAIFAARSRGCHVLLVGDVNQLPPVGRGAPFRDIIASGVCGYGELRQIMRNSGGIVEACAAIRDEQPWSEGDNLRIIETGNPSGQVNALIRTLEKLPNNINPVWDCQVLVAVNERSELSRKSINARLQEVLNPNPEVKGSPFRLDDKIVCTKNGRYTAIDAEDDAKNEQDRSEVYVANGELAKVVEIDARFFVAELTSPYRKIRIPRAKQKGDDGEGGSGCNFELAYGISCHRGQGSEWPVAIVMLDDYRGASMVCDRSWLYTGMSRAKQVCYLIGRKSTADAMCRRNNIHKRKTFLREMIERNTWADVLGDL